MPPKKSQPKSTLFEDLIVTLSGKFAPTQSAFGKQITEYGGIVASSVCKKTTHLVTNKDDVQIVSTKVQKAKEMGLPILDESFILDSIKHAKLQDEKKICTRCSG